MKTNLRNQRGFTLIELVVVMVILALLAAVAVPKFLDLQKQAEVASAKKVIGNIRSALAIRAARAIVDGEDLATLAANLTGLYPTDLLATIPTPYSGKMSTAAIDDSHKGTWCEASTNKDLIYVLKNSDVVTGGTGTGATDDPVYVRYEIEVVQEDINGETVNVGLVLEKYDGNGTVDLGTADDTDYDWKY